MSIESIPVEAYIEARLQSDPTMQSYGLTGYFSEKAPNQQPSPYIVWTQYSTQDVTEVAGFRVDVEVVYIVRVIGQVRSFIDIQSPADRIDALLHRSAGVALGHTILACVREAPYTQVEDYGDLEWRHLGGRFRFWVQ